MYAKKLTIAMVVLLIVISSISVRIGIESFRNNWEHFEVISAQSGVILVGLIILVCFNIREGLSFKEMLLKEKGTPVEIKDAFEYGEVVKVIAIDKSCKYTTLRNVATIEVKLVKLPLSHGRIAVGKHYQVGSSGELIDFIEAGKRSEKNNRVELVEEH